MFYSFFILAPTILLNGSVPVKTAYSLSVTIQTQDVRCSAEPIGAATADASGGAPPYTYLWDNGQTSSAATGLSYGLHSITVTDSKGCTAIKPFTIENIFSLTISATGACGGTAIGTATATPQNATAPFTYSWSNGQTASSATALMPGSYTVQITDGLGCTAMGTTTIQDATSYTDASGITVPSTPANQIWNSVNKTIKGGIYIPSGVTLTVNNSTLQFSEIGYTSLPDGEWGIIVDVGATLILNNCTLTSIANCPSMWDGIRVVGPGGFSGTYSATGKVILNSGNLIENAHTAIVSSGYLYYQYYNDGVIKIFPGNTFLNNRKHIVINGLRWSASNFRIEGSDFLCTGPLKNVAIYNNEGTSVFIELINFGIDPLQRINITGCNFSNTGSFGLTQRGTGIKGMHASFALQPYCSSYCLPPGECCTGSSTNNLIENLTYGVYAFANSFYRVIIKENQFTENYRGIYLQNIYGATITKNILNGKDFSTSGNYGLYLNGCTGYQVEENEVIGIIGNFSFVTGFIVNNSGSNGDEIYNNQFHDISVGVQPQGSSSLNSNEGLQIKCNDFTDNIPFYHITVTSGDIGDPQGLCPIDTIDPRAPAGNTFTHDCLFFGSDIAAHHGTFFRYNHHEDSITTPVCYDTVAVEPNKCIGLFFDSLQSCPSHLAGGGDDAAEIKIRITDFYNQTAALQANYVSVVDGGNTQGLLTTIATAPAGQIKDALINSSPYLSDTVMLTYLAKPNKGKGHVPVGHIKEVIIANSPVTKKVKAVVDSKGLPPGIQNEIDVAQTGISVRAELEGQIRFFERQRAITINELNRAYFADTLLTNPLDSVIAVLEKEKSIPAKLQLASAYISTEKFIEAALLLDSLTINPALSNFISVQRIIIGINQAGSNFDTLLADTALRLIVESIANDTLKYGYLIARAIMTEVFDTIYPELIEELPVSSGFSAKMNPTITSENQIQEESPITKPETKKEIYEEELIRVYPNPANEKIVVEYNFPYKVINGEAAFYDILGKRQAYTIKEGSGKLEINTKDFNDGLYYYTIIVNNNSIVQNKIIVIKNGKL